MLKDFAVLQLPAGSKLSSSKKGEIFILETCQRTLAIGTSKKALPKIRQFSEKPGVFTGDDAYRYLLEIHCGLKSRMIGEHEIVSQFKKAFADFLQLPKRNSRLIVLLEKLFKDGKEVRHKHLLQIGQQSYAGISRRLLAKKAKGQKVLVTGTGNMARDLIKVMHKHFQIVLAGRNYQKLSELCDLKGLSGLHWNCQDTLISQKLSSFPHIVNSIGTEEILFPPSFFDRWKSLHGQSKTFIDLGKPSPVETLLDKQNDVYRLPDIFEQGVMLDQIKQKKIDQAQKLIHYLVAKKNA